MDVRLVLIAEIGRLAETGPHGGDNILRGQVIEGVGNDIPTALLTGTAIAPVFDVVVKFLHQFFHNIPVQFHIMRPTFHQKNDVLKRIFP